MKKRTYPPKRTTLGSLLLRAAIVVLSLTILFAICFQKYLSNNIKQQCKEQISDNLSRYQKAINEMEVRYDRDRLMDAINSRLTMGGFNVSLDDPLQFDPDLRMLQIVPGFSEKAHSFAALIGENDNMAASGRLLLQMSVKFSEDDPDNGIYLCDRESIDKPEVTELYEKYLELSKTEKGMNWVSISFTSVYINRETHRFIPRDVTIKYVPAAVIYDETADTGECILNFTINDPDYELIEVHPLGGEYAQRFMTLFTGETQEAIDELGRYEPFVYVGPNQNYSSDGYESIEGNRALYYGNTRVYIDNRPYWLTVRFMFNNREPQLVRYYRKYTILFFVVLSFIAALWVWRRNVLNKARYAFEDYQRDLTDQLAHDIKTPLMAISGYAENIITGGLSPEEQKEYLTSILDNVGFTDSLISRTLFLNHIEGGERTKEETDLMPLIEETIKKYDLLLDERNITFKASGSASVRADKGSMETIIGNLISNAVKYTPENGEITAELSNKRLIISNTVSARTDTKELKRPFVRGDKARSNVSGHGLGLSIADRSAQANGMNLNISCTDKLFRAELRF